jgi:hypothetical protein
MHELAGVVAAGYAMSPDVASVAVVTQLLYLPLLPPTHTQTQTQAPLASPFPFMYSRGHHPCTGWRSSCRQRHVPERRLRSL